MKTYVVLIHFEWKKSVIEKHIVNRSRFYIFFKFQSQVDWEPVFTDNHTEHAASTCTFAILGTVLVVMEKTSGKLHIGMHLMSSSKSVYHSTVFYSKGAAIMNSW